MRLSPYSKVYRVGNLETIDLLDGIVLIQEKIDGSQFSFGVINGELFCRSKGANQYPTSNKLFESAVKWCEEHKDELKEGWTYRGEVLQKPKHHTLKYDRVPHNHIILFDIMTEFEENYLPYTEVEIEAARLGLEVVPCFYEGLLRYFSDAEKYLERMSILGGTKIEGVVIKNYSRYDSKAKTLMGKIVSKEFKEKQERNPEFKRYSHEDIVFIICDQLRTKNRWKKIVQHLEEDGKLERSERDISKLIVELQKDLMEEEKEFIKEQLFKHFKKKIMGKACAGFAEWYKQKLMEDMDNDKNSK